MDLRVYYQKVRQTVDGMPDKDVVIVSHATGDGGKAGVYTEVPKAVAAAMIVDGTAEAASTEDAAAFRQAQVVAKQRADQEMAATRVPLSLVTTAELTRLRTMQSEE
jgi:predicted alpha/beta hydrolase family esterase